MQIHIFHTNDIHAQYDNLSRISNYLKEHCNADDFYFDSGDFTDLKDLIVQSDRGISAIELLNHLKPDAMTIGNNEIDLSKDDLIKTTGLTNMICCNVSDNEDQKLPGVKDYEIFKRAGKRFLVIGIAPYYSREMTDNNFNAFFELYGLKVHPSIELIQKIVADNKGNYDFCILLSHNGITPEKEIQRQIPEIDLVLGGHSHSIEVDGNYNQTGMFAERLGKITLDVTEEGISIIENTLVECNEEDEEFNELLRNKRQYADESLSADLYANEDLSFDSFIECPLINFVCDALFDYFEADFAIMHNGIANFSLLCPVSRKTLIECFPSKLNPTIFRIKGEKLTEAIELSFSEEHIHTDGNGAGFRGSVLGTLSYSHNVQITKNPLTVKINGELLEKERIYTIVTDDYLQRGTGYPSFKTPDSEASWHIWFIRDLMAHYIQNSKVYEQAKIKRII